MLSKEEVAKQNPPSEEWLTGYLCGFLQGAAAPGDLTAVVDEIKERMQRGTLSEGWIVEFAQALSKRLGR